MSWSRLRMARYIAHSKLMETFRTNDEACLRAISDSSSKYLLFCQGKPLLRNSLNEPKKLAISWMQFQDTLKYAETDLKTSSILLGIDEDSEEGHGLFACKVPSDKSEQILEQVPESKFTDMRSGFLGLESVKEAGLVARGYTLINWNESTKFCSACGTGLVRNVSGTNLRCLSPTCNPKGLSAPKTYYPITHPVAITLVEHESDSELILLVRQGRHPKGMYSCIAGFMEPGESLEDAVRREIAEEAGIVVGPVKFYDSQTWPLPQNSLMLGCLTKAMVGSEKLDIDKEELEDAKWISKAQVIEAYDRISKNPGLLSKNDENLFLIPPKGAIAHDLLKHWAGII